MEKPEILDRIRNKLTMPRAVLQMQLQMDPQYQLAIQAIDELIKEIENDGRQSPVTGDQL